MFEQPSIWRISLIAGRTVGSECLSSLCHGKLSGIPVASLGHRVWGSGQQGEQPPLRYRWSTTGSVQSVQERVKAVGREVEKGPRPRRGIGTRLVVPLRRQGGLVPKGAEAQGQGATPA